MSPKISPKVCSILTAGLVIASLGTGVAAAASRDRHAGITHRIHHAHSWHHRNHFAHYRSEPAYGYAYALPPGAIVEPGYVFVPGRGILGEACNMPTSTCTNEYRDVQ